MDTQDYLNLALLVALAALAALLTHVALTIRRSLKRRAFGARPQTRKALRLSRPDDPDSGR